MNITVTMNDQGRIVIPKEMRQLLNIEGGQRLSIRVENDQLVLTPQIQKLRNAQELMAQYSSDDTESWANELIAERRDEAARGE